MRMWSPRTFHVASTQEAWPGCPIAGAKFAPHRSPFSSLCDALLGDAARTLNTRPVPAFPATRVTPSQRELHSSLCCVVLSRPALDAPLPRQPAALATRRSLAAMADVPNRQRE